MTRGHYGKLSHRRNDQLDPRLEHRPARVGGDLFHSVKDRQLAIEQITVGFNVLAAEIVHWQQSHANNAADPERAHALVQWIGADVIPTVNEWNAFAAREKRSWVVRAATSWHTFAEWRERLRNLRSLARAHGIALRSPDPERLPMTIWEKSDGGVDNQLAPWFGIAKIAIGAAITFTGAFTVYTVARDWARLRKVS